MEVYHVYPCDDLEEHHLECVYPDNAQPYCTCKCEPTYQQEDEGLLVIHNSFDGREGIEQANEILANSKPFE